MTTTTETPAQLLTRAATHIRGLAAEPHRDLIDLVTDPEPGSWDAIGPAIAEPLAQLLEHAAERTRRIARLEELAPRLADGRANGLIREPDVDLPLALAHALLDEPVNR